MYVQRTWTITGPWARRFQHVCQLYRASLASSCPTYI